MHLSHCTSLTVPPSLHLSHCTSLTVPPSLYLPHPISLTIVAVVVDRSVDIIHALLYYRLLQDRTLVVSHFPKHLPAPTALSGQLLRACESTKELLADRS